MNKSQYFPHDYNAIQDPKMMVLLAECGVAGVGLYWILIEIMHQQWGGIGLPEARHYIAFYGKQGAWTQHTLDTFEKVIFETKLLILKDGAVYSERVKNNLIIRDDLSKKGRENALKRWGVNANPMPTQCDPNANKVKESKVKEKNNTYVGSKPSFQKPTIDEIRLYLKDKNSPLDAEAFYAFYESNGWRVGKNPMRSWRAAVVTWEKNNFKSTEKKEAYDWREISVTKK